MYCIVITKNLPNPVKKILIHDHEYEIDGRGRNRWSNQLNISKFVRVTRQLDQGLKSKYDSHDQNPVTTSDV